MARLRISLPDDWLEDIQILCDLEGIPDRPGRVGGPGEWIVRLVARELEREFIDPHDEQAERLTGRPNPYHPLKR